jgi:hypothetical protein
MKYGNRISHEQFKLTLAVLNLVVSIEILRCLWLFYKLKFQYGRVRIGVRVPVPFSELSFYLSFTFWNFSRSVLEIFTNLNRNFGNILTPDLPLYKMFLPPTGIFDQAHGCVNPSYPVVCEKRCLGSVVSVKKKYWTADVK